MYSVYRAQLLIIIIVKNFARKKSSMYTTQAIVNDNLQESVAALHQAMCRVHTSTTWIPATWNARCGPGSCGDILIIANH